MSTTKKPTGLKITRKGTSFIFSWQKGDSYGDGQQLTWSYEGSNGNVTIFKNVPPFKIASNKESYTVTGLSHVSEIRFAVRGNHDQKKKDPGWSAWAEKSMKIKPPAAPKVTAAWNSSSPNKTTFTYEAKDDDNAPFSRVEYRTKWITDYNGDPEKYGWTGSPSTSSTKTGTLFNSTETVPVGTSKTRVVQCRSVGMGGASKWVFKSHTYAKPNMPTVTKASATIDKARSVISLNVTWKVQKSAARPIDKTTIQYLIDTPDAGMTVPAGANWTDADTPVTKDKYTWGEEINATIPNDKVMWVRIHVEHDTREDWSAPKIVTKGKLEDPTGVSVTPNVGTQTITVSATNASAVPDSYLTVRYCSNDSYNNGVFIGIVGIIPHGSNSVTAKIPAWSTLGTVFVQAVVGSYTVKTRSDGIKLYTVANPKMTSKDVKSGTMPAPTISVVQADIEETATVTWDWVDEDATAAEVSWSDRPDAWESTEEPDTYEVGFERGSKLNVGGLEAGKVWYFRVRLITDDGDEKSYGLYSETEELLIASAPAIPVLDISASVIDPNGEAIASWVYVSGDNTPQAHATLYTYSGGVYTPLLTVGEEQTAVINPADLGWTVGDYLLAVQVESESGLFSEISETVPVSVADPLTCSITQASLTSKSVTIDGATYLEPYVLTEMPMTVTVIGAGATGQTLLMIKRKEDYAIMRPDESDLTGYADEVVCQYVYTGEAQQTIEIGDVNGKLNDGATYYIEAIVTDRLGRTASDRYPADDPEDYFKVIWDDQAIMPDAAASIVDDDYAKLTINKPNDWQDGDTIDIYRLTADKPQMIAQGVEMDDDPVEYVDPYPTIGEHGGYRFVYRTKNGDDTMDSTGGNFAWLDIPVNLPSDEAIIDFNGRRLFLAFNMKVSNTWKKEFEETKYLGGSIVGDWTAGTTREGSIDAVTVPMIDGTPFEALRDLAQWDSICHVRTIDGSVMTANIDLKDDFDSDTAGKIQNVSLDFTRVDPVELDAMLLAEWLVTP